MTKYEEILSCLPQKFDPPIDLNMFPNIGIIKLEKEDLNIWAQMWGGLWYPLEDKDRNFEMVIDAIYKRLINDNIIQS